MKKEQIFTGKNVDEALKNGLDELGLEKDNIEYEVIEHEKRGILGIGAAPAKIKIMYEIKKDGGEIAVKYMNKLLEDMNLSAEVSFEKTVSNRYKLSVNGEGSGMLIGHHGDTLDSLQYLLNLAVNKRDEDGEKGEYMNITLDIENYREKREEALKSLARRMAAKVLKYKRSVTLEPMLPYERRIIHSEIQNIEGVSTNSVGVENNRKVVIYLEETGFKGAEERENGRYERRPSRERRANTTGERRSPRGSEKKSASAQVLERFEKKQSAKDETSDIDYSYDESDYSSTAYLREPTKRFSSFAEYESHMAELAAQGDKKDSEKKGNDEE